MHISSIIFIIAYFMPTFKMNYYYMLLIWLGCFLLSRMLDSTYISDLVNIFAEDSMIDIKVSDYLNDTDKSYTGEVTYTFQGIFSRLFILGLIYYVPTDRERYKSFLINLYFVGNCLFFLFGFNEIMALRTSLYFTSFEILAIPIVLYEIRDRFTFWLLLSFFVIRSFYQCYSLICGQFSDEYLPYKNVFINL
jgi:hypothetical protein